MKTPGETLKEFGGIFARIPGKIFKGVDGELLETIPEKSKEDIFQQFLGKNPRC